jgi:hypothetical protein
MMYVGVPGVCSVGRSLALGAGHLQFGQDTFGVGVALTVWAGHVQSGASIYSVGVVYHFWHSLIVL